MQTFNLQHCVHLQIIHYKSHWSEPLKWLRPCVHLGKSRPQDHHLPFACVHLVLHILSHLPPIPLLEQCCFCSGRWESSRKARKTQGVLPGMIPPAGRRMLLSKQLQHMANNFYFLWRKWTNSVSGIEGRVFVSQGGVVSTSAEAGVSDSWCFQPVQLCQDKLAARCLTAS